MTREKMITLWNWTYQSVTNQSTPKYQKIETPLKQIKIQEYKLMV